MLNFLGIGAQKSGTSWVYENLRQHPSIYFPGGKEVHFWDMFYDRGIQWYLSQFPDDNGKVNGDITPAYAILEADKIRMIHDLSPEVRIFYSLRDPRARAWSAAMMELEREKRPFADTLDEWFIEQFYSDASLKRGDYQTCLRNWYSVFPEDQILLVKLSEISEKPHDVLQRIAKHIHLPNPEFFAEGAPQVISKKVFANPPHPIRPSLKPVLHKLYCSQIEDFNTFMGESWFNPDDPAWKEEA